MKPKFLLEQLSSYKTLVLRIWAWCHHNARQNTAHGCKKRTFGWRASGSKRLYSSSLLKCWSLFARLTQLCWIISCRQWYLHFSFSLDPWSPKPALMRLNSWYFRSRSSSSYPLFFLHFQILAMQYIQWFP